MLSNDQSKIFLRLTKNLKKQDQKSDDRYDII